MSEPRTPPPDVMPVSVIGGYLGAGKTTLVNHLLRQADGRRIAVLVNEFGALPIDEDLIEAQDDGLISIAGGCVCCSYGNDLIRALLDLTHMVPQPDHVLVEASGVALPGAIAASVSLLEGAQMDGVIVLADADTIQGLSQDPFVGDTIERQLAEADLVVMTKTDLVSAEHAASTAQFLAAAAPGAATVPAVHGAIPPDVVMQPFARKDLSTLTAERHHMPGFQSDTILFDAPQDAESIAALLADASIGLIRAKGFVPTHRGLRAIQVVGRRWEVSEAPADATPGIVIIAADGTAALDLARKCIRERVAL